MGDRNYCKCLSSFKVHCRVSLHIHVHSLIVNLKVAFLSLPHNLQNKVIFICLTTNNPREDNMGLSKCNVLGQSQKTEVIVKLY